MAKKMQGSNSTGQTKAGKKSGSYTAPPAPSAEKRDARLAGEQQFNRNKGRKIGSVVQPKSNNEQVLDIMTRAFGVTRRIVKPFDSEYRLDENRGRVVVPEREFTNGY